MDEWLDWGFRVYFAMASGANFMMLVLIWAKL